jgi:hypothetical protein
MCKFFSFAWDGGSNFLYSSWDVREDIIKRESGDKPDSHTFILTHFGIAPAKQENWSTWEYNPLTGKLTEDAAVPGHAAAVAEAWVKALDFRTVVPQLVIKKIGNPLKGKAVQVTEADKSLLREWAAVWHSVRGSVWDSVWGSVGESVGESVWCSVGESVWESVRDSVWESVCAYVSSFFALNYLYDFSPAVKLWERGLVPSFDGTTWRLHSGKKAKIVFQLDKKELN